MEKTKKNWKTAKRYQQHRIILFFLNFFIVALFLFFFVRCRGAHALGHFVKEKTSCFWVQVFFYASSLALFVYCLEIPLRIFGNFFLERRYGLSRIRFKDWCLREGKKALLSLLFFLLLTETGYVFIWFFGKYWWLGFGMLWFIYSWFLAQIFPVWIVPLFYRYTPVQDEELIAMLKSFAQTQGRDIDTVEMIDLSKDTTKANAAVLGLGKRKRIVLGDTLMGHFGHEEIKVIFAHELGHDKERHLLASLLFNALVIFSGIYLIQKFLLRLLPFFQIMHLSDFAALPLFVLLFSLFGLLGMPVQNGFSRILERRADAFALRTTGLKEIFISAMKKLAKQNLADVHPARWVEVLFHSHPPISKRIAFAKKF